METIAADPALRDAGRLRARRRRGARSSATPGPVRDSAGELIGRIIVVREITAEREAARLKSELVATVSHELRTPLTGVLGFAELLMHHGLDEATQQALPRDHPQRGAAPDRARRRLPRRAEDRGRAASRSRSSRSSSASCSSTRSSCSRRSRASHELEFAAVDEPLAMVGDRNRIGQVIANLLSNAIKYSPAGGTVTITATPREGFARVQVTDSGLGIPAVAAGAGLHALLPRRLVRHARDRRHRPRARALPRDRDRARRPHRLREHGGRGQHVLVRAAERLARQRRRQPRAACS